MKKTILALAACVSIPSFADVPNTFVAGDIATAEAFNQNFQSLSSSIQSLKTETADIKTQIENFESSSSSSDGDGNPNNGYVTADVNGTPMKVISYSAGYYSILTPTGLTVNVDAEGYPTGTLLYYESNDCSDQPYIAASIMTKYMDKGVNHVFPNPKLSSELLVANIQGTPYYSTSESVVKLNYGSMKLSGNCSTNSGVAAAFKLKPNNPSITGIESFPLVISGVGSPLTISEEVGEPTSGNFNVYANGVKIGTTNRHPNPYSASDSSITVTLDGYSDKKIYLKKDGTYTGGGFSSSSETLYYTDSNCSGIAYVKVLSNGDTGWWDENKLDAQSVQNNGNHYFLSNEVYRASTTAASYRYNHSNNCYENTTALDINAGYKAATPISAPTIPVFSPPITIEGYTEPTPINSLPMMN